MRLPKTLGQNQRRRGRSLARRRRRRRRRLVVESQLQLRIIDKILAKALPSQSGYTASQPRLAPSACKPEWKHSNGSSKFWSQEGYWWISGSRSSWGDHYLQIHILAQSQEERGKCQKDVIEWSGDGSSPQSLHLWRFKVGIVTKHWFTWIFFAKTWWVIQL